MNLAIEEMLRECSVPGCVRTEGLTRHSSADELNGGTHYWAWCPEHEELHGVNA